MLTRKTKYALRALIFLARQQEGATVHIADLARAEGLPQKFLERILLDLKGRGLLRSQKGQGGGYGLRMPAREITVGDVVRFTDGPLAPVPCVSQTAYQPCTDCPDEATCALRGVMRRARDAIADVLDQSSLADLARRADHERLLAGLAHYEI
jgi:Rrf2 family protein